MGVSLAGRRGGKDGSVTEAGRANSLKKIKRAAMLAAVSDMPAAAREALACAVEVIEDFETRLQALEKKADGKN